MFPRNALVVMTILAFAPLWAAEEEEAKSPWDGKATLGYLATSGNTENSNLNSGLEVGYTVDSWRHRMIAKAINATEDEATTAESYEWGWKSEYNFYQHNYVFGRLSWRKDRFSGYDEQFSQTLGYGRRLIDGERHQLNAEVGAGARQSDLSDGTSEDEVVFRGGVDYKWKISDSSEFRQDFVVESGGENTYLESVTALSAKVIGGIALVASYTIKNNSEVPVGTEKTDTYTALSLEYLW